ncbi:transcription factor bHLH57-like isoform X2 [Phalaenopsis equestris]|uniref:transcription factor bHLH57-like isoform X2 n=1 Tax=Phalaenopsis equestris TaxID=78828 RepID=UPI0009E47484|nr:transcription factor bHLH57-like isoform X2 [Phalaenopsis equestris]
MESLHRHINSFFLEECMESKRLSCATTALESVFHGGNRDGKDSSFLPAAVERKKRKRMAAKNGCSGMGEAESQRMTHIVVERNRRRLMNEHLAALRSLMPSSFVQRGDQASIIGGAIDFIKELEQMLLSFQAEKSSRSSPASVEDGWSPAAATVSSFFVSPQYTGFSSRLQRGDEDQECEVDVEVTAVQGHVNLKVAGRRRPGQIVRAVAAMEELRLTVLHLSITSLDAVSVLYSLNLKKEEDCRLGSADDIASAVHQIFSTC